MSLEKLGHKDPCLGWGEGASKSERVYWQGLGSSAWYNQIFISNQISLIFRLRNRRGSRFVTITAPKRTWLRSADNFAYLFFEQEISCTVDRQRCISLDECKTITNTIEGLLSIAIICHIIYYHIRNLPYNTSITIFIRNLSKKHLLPYLLGTCHMEKGHHPTPSSQCSLIQGLSTLW